MIKNGVFLIDKPEKMTSFQVVKQIRKFTNIKKVGHTGTLDPFATGLLPICIGKATRISKYLLADKKTYNVQAKFGIQTDTGDRTGTIIKTAEKKITKSQFESIIPKIQTIDEQIPPQYSAVKINGKKAYEYARQNQVVELNPRTISIFAFSLTDFQFPYFSYLVQVSKGTYIRTLTEQIAELLGTIATTTELRRTEIGNLSLAKSVTLEQLQENQWEHYLLPIDEVLPQFPVLNLNHEQSALFLHGNRISINEAGERHVIIKNPEGMVIGLGDIEAEKLQPKLVFKED